MTDNIQDRVHKKLWLFKESPYYQKVLSAVNSIRAKGSPEISELLKHFDVWTVLSSILPQSMEYNNFAWTRVIEGSYLVNYLKSGSVIHYLFTEPMPFYENNIWQSILSLLKAIESHPDRDKFKYVWGED